MDDARNPIVIISREGRVTLPETILQQLKWQAGTRLVVEETPDGVLLKKASTFAPTRPEDVAGSLRYEGRPKTIEEMDAGIVAEARRRHTRGEY